MAPKTPIDQNLAFLYLCFQHVESKTIDFNAVAQAANINPPAARMRFTRLKKMIEQSMGSENDNSNSNDNADADSGAHQLTEAKGKKRAANGKAKGKGNGKGPGKVKSEEYVAGELARRSGSAMSISGDEMVKEESDDPDGVDEDDAGDKSYLPKKKIKRV